MIPAQSPLPGSDTLLLQLKKLCHPWRKLTIAIDGRNGAGKSSLARYLAWQLGMPAVETDLWLVETSPIIHDIRPLQAVIDSRHKCNRPIIIEGVAVLRTLESLGVSPDFVIMVINLD